MMILRPMRNDDVITASYGAVVRLRVIVRSGRDITAIAIAPSWRHVKVGP